MHKHRARQASIRASNDTNALNDDALALLFQRAGLSMLSGRHAAVAPCALTRRLHDTAADATNRYMLAVTTKHTLAQEVRVTETLLHVRASSNANDQHKRHSDSDVRIPTLHDLDDLVNDLVDIYSRSSEYGGSAANLSICEREYAQALEHAIVVALTHAVLRDHDHVSHQPQQRKLDHNPPALGDVRVWLLETAVRPTALARQLAFTLFLNVSVRAAVASAVDASNLCKTKVDDEIATVAARLQQRQTWLFHVLLEMLSKAVVVASSASATTPAKSDSPATLRSTATSPSDRRWVEHALACVLLFVKQQSGGRYRSDRLRALDPNALRFLLRERNKFVATPRRGSSSSSGSSTHSTSDCVDLDTQLLELVVFTLYAHASNVVTSDVSDTTGSNNSSCVGNDRPVATQFVLPLAALEPFGGIDLLLAHFYRTPVLATQRLLFMVFVDVAHHQLQAQPHQSQHQTASIGGAVLLDEQLQLWDFATCFASAPTLLLASVVPRVTKILYASASKALTMTLTEKQLQQFVTQLRLVLRVDEYFGESVALRNTLQQLRTQAKMDATDAVVAKVSLLLTTSRVEDAFQAERWLAELLTFGTVAATAQTAQVIDDPLSESVLFTADDATAATNDDVLEETCCFDESASVRLAARSFFWTLAQSPLTANRASFVRTLSVFIHRKRSAQQQDQQQSAMDALTGIARELNVCLDIVTKQCETSPHVLVPLLSLVLDVCRRDVSHRDRCRQQYDRQCALRDDDDHCAGSNGTTQSVEPSTLIAQFVAGDVALDDTLLASFSLTFFEHVLLTLETQSHPRQQCRQRCCGSRATSSRLGDAAVCAALIVAHMREQGTAAQAAESITALTPLLASCDSRVAVISARTIVSALKRSNCERYMEVLRELLTQAVDTDDATPLTCSLMLANALLARGLTA